MKCMHCLVAFHPEEKRTPIGKDVDGGWVISAYECPNCQRYNLFLVNADYEISNRNSGVETRNNWRTPESNSQPKLERYYVWSWEDYKARNSVPIRPKGTNRPPCPPEVPSDIAEDYNEACSVLFDSAKASAALSRRCLQNLLRDPNAGNVKHGVLASEIDEVLPKLPSYLAQMIDAIRNVGNIAAHPISSQTTGEILPVESHEAAWNLDVLEALFDFYYVQPAIIAKKRDALNAKLADSGSRPMK